MDLASITLHHCSPCRHKAIATLMMLLQHLMGLHRLRWVSSISDQDFQCHALARPQSPRIHKCKIPTCHRRAGGSMYFWAEAYRTCQAQSQAQEAPDSKGNQSACRRHQHSPPSCAHMRTRRPYGRGRLRCPLPQWFVAAARHSKMQRRKCQKTGDVLSCLPMMYSSSHAKQECCRQVSIKILPASANVFSGVLAGKRFIAVSNDARKSANVRPWAMAWSCLLLCRPSAPGP